MSSTSAHRARPRLKSVAAAAVALAILSLTAADAVPNITYPDAVLQHSDTPAPWDVFGRAVAVSGDTIVVGAPGDDNGGLDRGSAYVFEYNGGAWTQTKLVPPGNENDDQVGTSVDIDGDILVVSEFADGTGVDNYGAAHVYERESGGWVYKKKLTVPGLSAIARLGWKVTVSGNRIAATAIGAARVYIWERNAGAGNWSANPTFVTGGGSYGEDISLSGDLLLVGSRTLGAAYVYDAGINWALVGTLTGPISEAFGYTVSISDNTAVVGAPGASTGSIGAHGAVYVFNRNPSSGAWSSGPKLVAGEVPGAGTANDQLGTDVDVDGDMIVGGAWGDQVYAEGSGSAYIWQRSGGLWTETNKLIQPASGFGAGVLYHIFGRAVGTDGYRVVVGAPMYAVSGNPPLPGHAYVFDLAEPPAPEPPVAATLDTPRSTTVNTSTPAFTWDAVSNSTWYYLWVENGSGTPAIQQWYAAGTAGCGGGTGSCSVTPSTALADGAHRWWIRTFNDVGLGPWSSRGDFDVLTHPPAAATLVSPMGDTSTSTPTYTWEGVSSSTWYYLWVDGPGGAAYIRQWHSAAQVGCSSGGTCSVTPSVPVAASGAHKWWVQTWNSFGAGPWSARGDFNVTSAGAAPPAATLVSPSGTINTSTPTYKWNAVGNSTDYQLWVSDSNGAKLFDTWVTATDALCATGTGICQAAPSPGGPFDLPELTPGSYRFYIRTWNSSGYGPWSYPYKAFTVQ